MSNLAGPLQIAVAVMLDGTVAVEVASEHALLQWPFLSDMSLVDAIAKIFQLPPHLTDAQPNTTLELGTLQVRLACSRVASKLLQHCLPYREAMIAAVPTRLLPVRRAPAQSTRALHGTSQY